MLVLYLTEDILQQNNTCGNKIWSIWASGHNKSETVKNKTLNKLALGKHSVLMQQQWLSVFQQLIDTLVYLSLKW